MDADIVIIGAGAVGTALARELSKYQLKIVLVEKEADICAGTSKANSGVIHTGFDAPLNTLESTLVTKANLLFDQMTQELNVPFKRIGAFLVAVNDEQDKSLEKIYEKGISNGVRDISFISLKKLLELEPFINPKAKRALYIPRESIICPFNWVIALAENAWDNEVWFLLNTKVKDIKKNSDGIEKVICNNREINTKWVVNAAGLYSDSIAKMVGIDDFKVSPRKGEFYVFDKDASNIISHIILPAPTKKSKGIIATPTVNGNMIIGPTAEDITDKTDTSTTEKGLTTVLNGIKNLIPSINKSNTIAQYAGLRAVNSKNRFIVEVPKEIKGFLNITGIRSTGITASPTIALYALEQLKKAGLKLIPKEKFNPFRKPIKRFNEMTNIEREKASIENPLYSNIICRCELISEAEVVDAINRPLGARTLDGLKRRIRTSTGRCQGGFCTPRILKIMQRELDINIEDLTKNGVRSNFLNER